MDKTFEVLKKYKAHEVGARVTFDDADAGTTTLVDLGYIKAIAEASDAFETAIGAMMSRLEAKCISGIEATIKAQSSNGGSGPRIDAGAAELDKKASFGDHVKHIIRAMCPLLFPGEQMEARETLEKVYKSRFSSWEQKDLAEGSGITGGYTVAPMWSGELLKFAAEMSIVRPFANVKTIPAREAFFPMLNQTGGAPAAGTSNYFGGVQMQWTAEAQARPQVAEPNFKQLHVVTNELSALAKVSRTLLADSMIAFESELRQLFGEAIAWAEDYAFLQGDGLSKPKGILNAGCLLNVGSRATGNQFKLADAAKIGGGLMPQSRPKMIWVMTAKLFEYLVQLVDGSGRVTYIPNVGSGYNNAPLMAGFSGLMLFGRPVMFTEKLPALGTAGDVLAADFSRYIIADTGTIEVAASDQYAFNTNQITFRVIKRVDGRAQLDNVFTMADGTTTVSPFCVIS